MLSHFTPLDEHFSKIKLSHFFFEKRVREFVVSKVLGADDDRRNLKTFQKSYLICRDIVNDYMQRPLVTST
jgi:hypothetical protein